MELKRGKKNLGGEKSLALKKTVCRAFPPTKLKKKTGRTTVVGRARVY